MNVADIFSCREDFRILQTTSRTQTAVMRLNAGGSSAETPQAHPHSDQVVLVIEGEMEAEVEGGRHRLPAGACLLIPAGRRHIISNRGGGTALAFTTYAPPAYPAGGF